MKLKNIDLPMVEIERFARKWRLSEFSLFGSVLRDDFRPDSSDIDVMIEFHPDAVPSSFLPLDQMEEELQALFGREVDVITRFSIENSRNPLRRQEILSSAQIIYESRPSVTA